MLAARGVQAAVLTMPVKIRLARIGCKHEPIYRINVANSWAKRDGRHIEDLGRYDARPDTEGTKRIQLNFERVRYWISVGAQPTDRVAFLLGKVLHLLPMWEDVLIGF